MASVTYGNQKLNEVCLVIIDSCMPPYLRAVIQIMSSLVNDDQHGQHMIQTAQTVIESDEYLHEAFTRSIKAIDGLNLQNTFVPHIYEELSRKLFHARVNE